MDSNTTNLRDISGLQQLHDSTEFYQ